MPNHLHQEHCYVTLSRGVASIPLISTFLGAPVVWLPWRYAHRLGWPMPKQIKAVVGWGRRPGTEAARELAKDLEIPYLALEDGFLRSFGTGEHFPPLSIVVDPIGIYYDSRSPSALENLLNSSDDLLSVPHSDLSGLRKQIVDWGLSKYNHAPDLKLGDWMDSFSSQTHRILVVDQTVGDMSVACGGADQSTFTHMLAAARDEHPGATIYVKTHPEVSSGRKRGYLTDTINDPNTIVLRDPIHPMSLIRQMDHVYVVSSTLGFEALMADKPVTCFGLPWYAGWGATDDRQSCVRRQRKRSVDELFAAAYWHYPRYINPRTHAIGTLTDILPWLLRQREMASALHGADGRGRVISLGMPRWKSYNLKPMLGLYPSQVHAVKNVQALEKRHPQQGDHIAVWGVQTDTTLAHQHPSLEVLHLEDGFVRSVGLGSDMIRPMSLVMDRRGLYFDATRPSDLEVLLNTATFDEVTIKRAQDVRRFIVDHGITKYNMEPRHSVSWPSSGKRVLLVPGQVEDDASIRLGCTTIRTNRDVLANVRQSHPDAYVVYKPHPDVMSGNRKGHISKHDLKQLCDWVETDASIVDAIEACDEVHTLTSLSGFDALIRQKRVVTYGQPFYAGWGLTEDRCPEAIALTRRNRVLTLDELVAGVLLHYPLYWDWTFRGYTTCEDVLNQLLAQRERLVRDGELINLQHGYLRRQLRKLTVLIKAWTTPL